MLCIKNELWGLKRLRLSHRSLAFKSFERTACEGPIVMNVAVSLLALFKKSFGHPFQRSSPFLTRAGTHKGDSQGGENVIQALH